MSSRAVRSKQVGPHRDLLRLAQKHASTLYKKPIAEFSEQAFLSVLPRLLASSESLILDSFCGVGESTVHLAKRFPTSFVLAVDQSKKRTEQFRDHYSKQLGAPENCAVIRADVFDIWRLFLAHNLNASQHFILYPNPWPKTQHLMRRVHGHPLFPVLLELSRELTLRSNWKIYVEEFALALSELKGVQCACSEFEVELAITPFERKYVASGQKIYQLCWS